MKRIWILIILIVLAACSEKTDNTKKKEKEENLVEIKNGKFTEWYPGKKQIKFQGMQDSKSRRNGKWTFYSENGNVLSLTMFENGKKEGFTMVKYPNGYMHYTGEYHNDKKVGVWTTYDEKGKKVSTVDFGFPEE